MPAGRPTEYNDKIAEQAYKLCLLGFTDIELADFFKVSKATINNWKKDHPEFLDSITRGKDVADADVAHSLYHRAKGYSHPDSQIFLHKGEPVVVETTKHYPPDTNAARHWLNNRQPRKWRDKKYFEGDIRTEEITLDLGQPNENEPGEDE